MEKDILIAPMTNKRTVTDKDLDEIYDAVDLLMCAGAWTNLDHLFAALILDSPGLDLDILLTYATVSFPGKSHIPHRKEFMDKCMKLHPDPSLWAGLT